MVNNLNESLDWLYEQKKSKKKRGWRIWAQAKMTEKQVKNSKNNK